VRVHTINPREEGGCQAKGCPLLQGSQNRGERIRQVEVDGNMYTVVVRLCDAHLRALAAVLVRAL
jgi:hypothetical protein